MQFGVCCLCVSATLTLLLTESLDQMTTWAVEKFKDVRSKDIDPPAFDGHALTSNELMVGICASASTDM